MEKENRVGRRPSVRWNTEDDGACDQCELARGRSQHWIWDRKGNL